MVVVPVMSFEIVPLRRSTYHLYSDVRDVCKMRGNARYG